MAATDDIVEEEADDAPGDVVGGRRWGNETCAAEDDGPVDVLEDGVVEPLLDDELQTHNHNQQPHFFPKKKGDTHSKDGSQETSKEEEDQAVVNLAVRELAGGSNNTPDDGGGTKDLSGGADEIGRAHV